MEKELREKFNIIIQDTSVPFIPDDDHLVELMHSAYQLGEKSKQEEVEQLEKECAALRQGLAEISTYAANNKLKSVNEIVDKYRPTRHTDVRILTT